MYVHMYVGVYVYTLFLHLCCPVQVNALRGVDPYPREPIKHLDKTQEPGHISL
jgi:hypothetical protein